MQPSLLQQLAALAPRLKAGELRILLYFAALTDASQQIKASTRSLAKSTGLSPSTAYYGLESLKKRGLVTVVMAGSARERSVYRVNFPLPASRK